MSEAWKSACTLGKRPLHVRRSAAKGRPPQDAKIDTLFA